jgi:hypothetical protein
VRVRCMLVMVGVLRGWVVVWLVSFCGDAEDWSVHTLQLLLLDVSSTLLVDSSMEECGT